MPQLPGFIGPAYTSRSINAAVDRLVNLYPEVIEHGAGKHVAAFYGTPGLRRFATLPGSGAIRGAHTAANGRVFAVRGERFYEVFSAGPPMIHGFLASSVGPVSMDDNGEQVMLVDGTQGYIFTLATSVFADITDPDLPASPQVVFLDGYFVFFFPNSGQFGITALQDGFTVDSLDVATAEGSPDNIVGILADHRELWVFGTKTIEVYFNTGNPDFPFERIQGTFIEYGCGAAFSPANLDNTVYWLGSDERGQHMVFRATGYQPQRVSTHAIEFAISTYTATSRANARGYTYQESGHSYYVLNFDEATWCYDVASGLWHERARLLSDGTLGRHRGQCHTVGFGEHLVGDFEGGQIYAYDHTVYTDDGAALPRMRTCPHMHADLNWLRLNWLELDLETGVGIDGGGIPGTDPQLMLQFSDDGGHTWSNERWVSAGPIGAFRQRAIWRRLGRSRNRVYRIMQTDPVKTAWINAKIQPLVGTS